MRIFFSTCLLPLVFFFSSQCDAADHLIFVPGFSGTQLLDASSGEVVWPNSPALILNSFSLELPIAGSGRAVTQLKVGKPISSFSFFKIKKEIYSSTFKLLAGVAKTMNARFLIVRYDWRREPTVGALAIDRLIKSLKLSTDDRIYFVGHSYGALILSYYLRYGTQSDENPNRVIENWVGTANVQAVVFTGTPFRGSDLTIQRLAEGFSVLLNSKYFSAFANGTMPASYFLLPNKMLVRSAESAKTQFSLRSIADWEKLGIGVFSKSNQTCRVSPFACGIHAGYWLQRAKNFKYLIGRPAKNYTGNMKITNIQGVLIPTPALEKLKFESQGILSFESSTSGDGTVSAQSSLALSWMNGPNLNQIAVHREHMGIAGSLGEEIFLNAFNYSR